MVIAWCCTVSSWWVVKWVWTRLHGVTLVLRRHEYCPPNLKVKMGWMWCLWWMGRSAHLEGLERPDEQDEELQIWSVGLVYFSKWNWEWNLITEWTLKWTLTDSPLTSIWKLVSALLSLSGIVPLPWRVTTSPEESLPHSPPLVIFLCPWSADEGGGNTLTAVQYLLHRRYYRPCFTAMGPVAMANPHLQVCYPDSISSWSVEVTAHGLQQILTDSRNWMNCNEMQKVSIRTTSWPTH